MADPKKKKTTGKKARKGEKVRVHFRRNRSPTARDKSWTRQYREHGFEAHDTVARESLIPKGELSRKRTIVVGGEPIDKPLNDGIVVTMRGLIAEVDDGERIWPCTVRRILRTLLIKERHPVTVGDQVQFLIEADTEGLDRTGVIYSVYERTSQLARRYGDRVHVIAANVDQALIMGSVDQPVLKPHLIDRSLGSAHAGNITPLICINKIDLGQVEEAKDVAEMYRQIKYPVFLASALGGEGIDDIAEALTGKTTVIVGQSGVGKSSVLNSIQPGLRLVTREVSEATSKGRHATTTTSLMKLDRGGYVVDTPGVKSYEMGDVPRQEYEMYFVEFLDHVPHCKFPDCTHTHEGKCAVKMAVEQGQIDSRRHQSYVRMFEEG